MAKIRLSKFSGLSGQSEAGMGAVSPGLMIFGAPEFKRFLITENRKNVMKQLMHDGYKGQTSRSRRGGPPTSFDAASLCTVARTGVDPAAIMVDPIMPRFTLSDDDCRDLWAFLGRRS